jgi:SRSO17 transposase
MLDGRRTSIQPMAERLPDGNEQNLQRFVNQSTWNLVPVRRRIVERMVPLIGSEAWVVDDVAFPHDGKMSVAVARPFCGALGKRANCQVALSVHAVSDAASCPLQWRLLVPQEWAAEPVRRRKTAMPQEVGHRQKWRLALDSIDELAGWGMVPPVLVADAGYRQNADFRDGLDGRGIGYVVASVRMRPPARTTPSRSRRPGRAAAASRSPATGTGPPRWPRWRRARGGRPSSR